MCRPEGSQWWHQAASFKVYHKPHSDAFNGDVTMLEITVDDLCKWNYCCWSVLQYRIMTLKPVFKGKESKLKSWHQWFFLSKQCSPLCFQWLCPTINVMKTCCPVTLNKKDFYPMFGKWIIHDEQCRALLHNLIAWTPDPGGRIRGTLPRASILHILKLNASVWYTPRADLDLVNSILTS